MEKYRPVNLSPQGYCCTHIPQDTPRLSRLRRASPPSLEGNYLRPSQDLPLLRGVHRRGGVSLTVSEETSSLKYNCTAFPSFLFQLGELAVEVYGEAVFAVLLELLNEGVDR